MAARVEGPNRIAMGKLQLPLDKMPLIYQMLAGRDLTEVLAGMDPAVAASMRRCWDLNCLPHQRMPAGDWSIWALLGGRGIGKTITTSKTAHKVAARPDLLGDGIIGFIGRTHGDVRETNVEAKATGILASAPLGFRPKWKPGPGILEWPNGVRGRVFSADSPEAVLGSNIAFLIADEVARWPDGETTWNEIIEFAVRAGRAQIAISTTPKPLKWLRKICNDPQTVVTHATTYDNPFLPLKRRQKYERLFKGTRLEREALLGEFIDSIDGALLKGPEIENHRVHSYPELVRVVISVDPAVTSTKRADMTGIVVLGLDRNGHVYVLQDASGKYKISNNAWAERVVELYRYWEADIVVAEINRAWEMVEGGIRAVSPAIPFKAVKASRGKLVRAEPVGMLYEQGKIHHVGELAELEVELTSWIPGDPSPNRMDALVWGATYLLLSDDDQSYLAPYAGML